MSFFVDGLRAADSGDVGLIVACATHWRHRYQEEGINLLTPSVYVIADPTLGFRLAKQIQELQRQRVPHLAVGLMVWLHSFRALSRPELRGLGREMWAELQRGFHCADEVALRAISFIGFRFQANDCDRFPDGLTPTPR